MFTECFMKGINLASRIVAHICESTGAQRYRSDVLKTRGDDTVLYRGYTIEIVQDLDKKKISVSVEGEDLGALSGYLSNVLQEQGVEPRDKGVTVSREYVGHGGEKLEVILTLSAVNNADKVFYAFFREGIKPVMKAIHQLEASRQQ